MCGIVGTVVKNAALQPNLLDKALEVMYWRGPDDKGTMCLAAECGANAVFGHRRLSILDISSAGHQPMTSPDGQLTIVYNGEIYNFLEIRKELEQYGYVFHTRCDTEVILIAYKHWGEDFITRCNGMFAIALWDNKEQKIVLYRDRIGIKPLYLGMQRNKFYFASVLSAVAAIDGFEREVDHNALLAYIFAGYVPSPYAMFAGMQKLLPGHKAVFDLKKWKLEIKPYWLLANSIDVDEDKIPQREISDYIDELEALLTDAVRLRLISDVPLGAFLSGGIDSPTMVALMKQVHRGKTSTFSIGFDVDKYDESKFARQIAQHIGTEHHEQILSADDMKPVMKEVPVFYDEPFSDSSCLPTMLLCRMARKYVTVAISGDGGDESFYGAYRHYHLSYHWKWNKYIPYTLRKFLGNGLSYMPQNYLRRLGESLQFRTFGQYYQYILSMWQPGEYPNLIKGDVSEALKNFALFTMAEHLEKVRRSVFHTASALDFQNLLPDDYLVKVDRASMSCALEVRVPLLDYRVVEFAQRTPTNVIFHNREHKFLLKSILRKYVPQELWQRPKKGFEVPLSEWFRTDLYQFLRENLLDNGGLPFDIFSRDVIERIIADHKSGHKNRYRLLWSLLSLSMWYRHYIQR